RPAAHRDAAALPGAAGTWAPRSGGGESGDGARSETALLRQGDLRFHGARIQAGGDASARACRVPAGRARWGVAVLSARQLVAAVPISAANPSNATAPARGI